MSGAPFDAGPVRFAGTFPALLVYLPAGIVADRRDRKRVMTLTEGARLVAMASHVRDGDDTRGATQLEGVHTLLTTPAGCLPFGLAVDGR